MIKLRSQFINNTPYDERILSILRQSESSLPSTSIALLIGLSMDKVDRILSVCQKHGLVRRVTVKEVSYWKFVGADNDP